MKSPYINPTVAALSVIAAAAVGMLAPVTTAAGWFILAAAATAPPLVFMHYLKQPDQTTSQAIREAIH